MQLSQIIAALDRPRPAGPVDGDITALSCDSRQTGPGTLFAALRGELADGHHFISAALENGASAILAEQDVPPAHRGTWITVKDSHRALAEAADAFFGHPSRDLLMAGITGTNGKTTTAFIIQHLVAASKGRCGLIGTVRYDLGDETLAASRTTPDAIQLQRLLDIMRSHGCAGASMEVSSHALQQQRVHGIEFDSAVFTNLTQDHLDYHKTMENYFAAKAKLFDHLAAQKVKKKPAAAINIDDEYGRRLAAQYAGKLRTLTFGMGFKAEFRASDIQFSTTGASFALEHRDRKFLVRLPLIGRFNIFNALGAVAAAYGMGLNLREAIQNLATCPQVPGRLQAVGQQKAFRVFVDYAHTPDALENALKTLRELRPSRILTVFGCGGDRDAKKRPLMGAAAEQLSTYTILTSDNPRSEDPEKILSEIESGMRSDSHEKVLDRREAIHRAIELANEGDVVLIAGKGHETEQIFADSKVEFDDVKVAAGALKKKGALR